MPRCNRIHRRFSLLACCWLAAQLLCSQPAAPFQTSSFSTREGLPHNAVHALCEDRDGYLWIGTEAGLSRYNGYQFETFLEADGQQIGRVYSLYETPDGALWIGTETGIFMGLFGKIHVLGFSLNGSQPQVRSFIWDQKRHCLWFAGASGIFNLSVDQVDLLKKIPATKSVVPGRQAGWLEKNAADPRAFVLELDERNQLWAGTSNSVFCCTETDCRPVWTSPRNDDITCLLSSGNGHIFWGGNTTTLFGSFQGNLRTFADSMYYVTDLFKHHGASYFFSAGEMYRLLDQRVVKIWDHAIRVGISDVLIDRENNVWVASWEGLIKISPRFFEQIAPARYPQLDELYGLALDREGALLLGANHGKAYRMSSDVKNIHPLSRERICPNANINDFFVDKWGRQWMATEYEGLALLEAGKTRLFGKRDGLHDEGLFAFLPTRKGDLWAMGDNGATWIALSDSRGASIKPKMTAVAFAENKEGITTLIGGVEDPAGGIWLGGNRGLYKYQGGRLEEVVWWPNQVLNISGIQLDRAGQLWLATLGAGLICCSWEQNTWQIKQIFTEKDGLHSDNLLALLADSKGRIWLGYGYGIGLLERGSNTGARIRYFNEQHGLFPQGCRRMRFLEARDGAFWIASPVGLCRFDPERFTRNEVAPLVRIRSVKLLDGYYDESLYCDSINSASGLPEGLALPYSLNNLRFAFDGLSLTNPENNHFRFMLAGADPDWRLPDKGHLQVTYPKLPPGDYTFYVEAANSDGVWASKPAVFQFKIYAPFWQESGFWLAVAALFVLITVAIAKKRVSSIQAREHEKTRIQTQLAELRVQALRAQINPHFIFNCLAGIQQCVLQEQFMAANDYLTQFARLLRLNLEYADQSYISFQKELEILRLYVELENKRLQQQIDYQIDMQDIDPESKLRIPAFVIQPFVENAIWHGLMPKPGIKKLSICISLVNQNKKENTIEKKILTEEYLIIEIEDNGIGRAAARSAKRTILSTSKGISIIQERLALLDPPANIAYEDLKDPEGKPHGTRVRISIPLAALPG